MKQLFLLLLLLPTGCIKEDFGGCPPKYNTTVLFNLTDKAGNDLLAGKVDHIDLFLYDTDGKHICRHMVTRSEFPVKRLQLAPGTYTLVAWANATEERTHFFIYERIHYLDRMYNHLLTAVPSNGVTGSGDPLWYAPKSRAVPLTVTVPEEGNVEVTAHLRHAHVQMEVVVEGYDRVASRAADPLTIELTDITSRYDFGMGAHGDPVRYVGLAEQTGNEHYTLLNVPVFDRNSTTQIRVLNSAGRNVVKPIPLIELLGEKIDVDELQHLPIRIRFTQEDGLIQAVVTVELPGWDNQIVTPNI